MVDVLQHYMQDALSLVRLHRADASNHTDHHVSTVYGARRRATEKQRERIQQKEHEKELLDRSLYHVKETPAPTIQIPSNPKHGLACKTCAPLDSVSEKQLN